jgi:hypothetical protein
MDEALVNGLKSLDGAALQHAVKRLGLINRYYSVYLNLVLVGIDGKILACSHPEKFPRIIGAAATRASWFQKAMATTNGDQYVVDDICHDPLHGDKLVAVYAAAVRKEGKANGKIIGVLGVVFDWEEQSRTIVQKEPAISEASWKRTRVMLIAASDHQGVLAPFTLQHTGRQRGHYVNDKLEVIAYAKSLGYQEYDGLGWYAVIVQRL